MLKIAINKAIRSVSDCYPRTEPHSSHVGPDPLEVAIEESPAFSRRPSGHPQRALRADHPYCFFERSSGNYRHGCATRSYARLISLDRRGRLAGRLQSSASPLAKRRLRPLEGLRDRAQRGWSMQFSGVGAFPNVLAVAFVSGNGGVLDPKATLC